MGDTKEQLTQEQLTEKRKAAWIEFEEAQETYRKAVDDLERMREELKTRRDEARAAMGAASEKYDKMCMEEVKFWEDSVAEGMRKMKSFSS